MLQTRPLTVEEMCNKLRPVFGKKVDELYFQYSIADGRDEREEIAHMLSVLYQKHLSRLLDKSVLLEPPTTNVLQGEYSLADISYAGRTISSFGLRESDWKRHMCVTGMSGSGKTTFAFQIIDELSRHNKPFLIFDWKKSFRPLIASDNRLLLFTIGDEKVTNVFKTNINRPPKGVAPKEWITVLADLLTEGFMASFGVHKVILETLDEAFKEWGIYNGSENYPTWKHIKWRLEEKAKKTEGREAGWLESALRIATLLTFGDFGTILNYKGNDAVSVEELLDKKVIMELNALGNVEKKFFCEYILTYIYKLKKAKQNEVSDSFDHAIIVDEAHNIFLKKQTNFANESVTDMIYREMREYGTSLICLDQHISKISDTVKGNSACHIAFQQQLPQDIEDVSRLMQLQENKHFFSTLTVGEAIVKLAERYTQAFLIKTFLPKSRLVTVSNEDVKARMQSFLLGKEYLAKKDPEWNKTIENPKGELHENENKSAHEISVSEEKSNASLSLDLSKLQVSPSSLQNNVPTKTSSIGSNVSEGMEISANSSSEKGLFEGPSEVQEMLVAYIQEHVVAGVSLEDIEHTLERSKVQGGYTSHDIMHAVNSVFKDQLTKPLNNKISLENSNKNKVSGLNPDEQKFIEFLQENPSHQFATVEVYKQIGFSPRKGTVIKKSLEEKDLITIEEIKYEKGWKKFIRLR